MTRTGRSGLGGPVFTVMFAAVLFGAATPISKLLLQEVPPIQLAALLYVGGAFGLLPAVRRRTPGSRERVERQAVLKLFGAIIFGGILGPVLMLLGLRLASAASVSLWLNMEVVATAVLGHVLFREHLARFEWFGVAGVVLAGVLVSGAEGASAMTAAVLVTLACVCWGLDNHLTALIDGMSATRATFWKCAVAGVVNLFLGVMVEPFAPSVRIALTALAVGALSYGVSIVLYITAAQQLGATRSQMLFATAPFFGVAFAAVLLGEVVTGVHAAAALLMIGAVAVMFAARHAHVHAHAALAHTHVHSHDDGHHLHEHAEATPAVHEHWHEHEPTVHAHGHWPDLHHRHRH